MEILKKLQTIQSELKVNKNQFNKFGNYKYRNCEDILEAVKPLLLKTKTTLILDDEVVQIGDRYYVQATVSLRDENEKIETTAFARETENKKGMDESQITGAASSYARKYALNGLFCIDDGKDADSQNNTAAPQNKPPVVQTVAQQSQQQGVKVNQLRNELKTRGAKTEEEALDIVEKLTVTRVFNKLSNISEGDAESLLEKFKTIII